MQISSTLAATLRPSATAAVALLGRLTQALPSLPGERLSLPRLAVGTLTPEMIRATLLEMGASAAGTDVALAEALAQVGLPLSGASLAEANSALARAPGVAPQAYALAKSLGLPTTPDGLKALTAVLTASEQGVPASQALPVRVRERLGLSLDADTAPQALARHLGERMRQAGRSTENRLLAREQAVSDVSLTDARTVLLRLAQTSGNSAIQSEADRLAAHLEGQQLLNLASLQAHADKPVVPLYLAVPLLFEGVSMLAEMRLWSPRRRNEADEDEEREPSRLRVTVRVTPSRLGRVQADLSGCIAGSLSCRLGVEKPAAQRLLARNTGTLAEALSAAGWPHCEVRCQAQSAWPPLWHGGDALSTPRTCVDRYV